MGCGVNRRARSSLLSSLTRSGNRARVSTNEAHENDKGGGDRPLRVFRFPTLKPCDESPRIPSIVRPSARESRASQGTLPESADASDCSATRRLPRFCGIGRTSYLDAGPGSVRSLSSTLPAVQGHIAEDVPGLFGKKSQIFPSFPRTIPCHDAYGSCILRKAVAIRTVRLGIRPLWDRL